MKSAAIGRTIALWAGPLSAIALLTLVDLAPGQPEVTRTAAVAVWMALWWVTEAIPIPATALLPVALFPLLGVMNGNEVAGSYFNNVIFLFIGGFIVALAMERWNLHRRIALYIVSALGTRPRRLLLGFMAATAFLSMWISNTAATMMMVPIALAVCGRLAGEAKGEHRPRYAKGILIGIAYGASIGGLATLIGTPPNLALARIYAILYPEAPALTFAGWILFGLPVAVVLFLAAYVILNAVFLRGAELPGSGRSVLVAERKELGPMRYEEKTVLFLFIFLATLWMFRSDISLGAFTLPGWSRLLPRGAYVDDGTVAMVVALLLFVWPSRSEPGRRLMNWKTASRLHWGIVILFGGGFALATGFETSGLSLWIAERLAALGNVPNGMLVAITCTGLTFLTELTSNTATTQMILPLLGALSVAIQVHPLLLMVPATLSASCAFMLPVATPPNAIVFGSGEVRISDMLRSGIIMNLVGVVLITGLMYLLGLTVFGIDPGSMPAWATRASPGR